MASLVLALLLSSSVYAHAPANVASYQANGAAILPHSQLEKSRLKTGCVRRIRRQCGQESVRLGFSCSGPNSEFVRRIVAVSSGDNAMKVLGAFLSIPPKPRHQ